MLYTASLGGWAYLLVALAAFTRCSATLTCLDGLSRSASAGSAAAAGIPVAATSKNQSDHSLWIGLHGFAGRPGFCFFLAASRMGKPWCQLAMVVSVRDHPPCLGLDESAR